jgi:phenylalanyl-tRNA synthetase alpha subunit
MQMAGTPCPFEGKIGPDALSEWTKYDVERPDYETYIEKLKTRSQIDRELEAIRIEEEQKELARKLEEEKKKLATLLEQEEVDKIKINIDIPPEQNKIINVHN